VGEARQNPLNRRWTIVAPGRDARPHDERRPANPVPASPADRAGVVADCPFCAGHESWTPPEVARRGGGGADGPGWDVRVVPNRYPIVEGAGGVHEVVVLSPDHHRSFAHLTDEQAVEVMATLRDRARVHAAAGWRGVHVILNHGASAGASLTHPHAQILAVDLPAPAVLEEVAHLVSDGGCALCVELGRLDQDTSLVVTGDDQAVAWCPWWSSTAFELLVAPRRHAARFEDAGAELDAVAAILRRGLAQLDAHLGDPPYNLFVHTRPTDRDDDFHWHIHIRPRLQVDAGFELGTGLGVDTLDPAVAADRLR
jgi:UDPglucose--hexose-1-phosphate uridylyltransferase